MKGKREAYFDNARWILILLVVFGHIIRPIQDENSTLYTLYTTIYLFHMAGFILISGYFAKHFRRPGYIKKIAKKTLLPYLIFQLAYAFFYYVSDIINGKGASLDLDFLSPHFSLWFLLSLFCWNLFLFLFTKFPWWVVLIAFGLGIAIGYTDVSKFLSISRTFVFFPFFLLGYYLKPEFFKQLCRISWRILGGCILGSLLLVFYIYSPDGNVQWLEGAHSYTNMGIDDWHGGFVRLVQYALMLLSVFSVLSLIPNQHLKITIIGTRTLYIYLLHGFIIQAIRKLVSSDLYEWLADNIILLGLFTLAVVLFLGSYRIKKITQPFIELKSNREEGSMQSY